MKEKNYKSKVVSLAIMCLTNGVKLEKSIVRFCYSRLEDWSDKSNLGQDENIQAQINGNASMWRHMH